MGGSINLKKEDMSPVSECDYPLCPSAKDAAMELERHQELRKDLEEIKENQGKIALGLQDAVIRLEKIALIFSEMDHLRNDLNNLGDKLRTFEENVWREINAIKQDRVTWLQQVIILLVGGGAFGIGGFLLSKLWN